MGRIAEYKQQYDYRSWERIFDALPDVHDLSLLDLGCGVGDQAFALTQRGARVIGVDGNAEFIAAARERNIAHAEFHCQNLQEPLNLIAPVDGIWCSFTAAYFPNLSQALVAWSGYLRPGGFIALTEVDDMFGHEPVQDLTKWSLDRYVEDSFHAGRYDFRMGRKLRAHLEETGFTVQCEFAVPDRELAFDGAASEDVLVSWRNRFDRMKLLQLHCGADFVSVRDDFLACLSSTDHRALAQVRCAIAVKNGDWHSNNDIPR